MNGFLNINKPAGMTSAAVVGVLKRLTGEKRVGHAGTLDPQAAGVLPIMMGRATRLFDYLVDKEKEYVAVCAFGSSTDTQDATGRIIGTGDQYPDLQRVEREKKKLIGDIIQKPGMYSAIKVDGKRLYALARAGETAEVPERMVHVESITIMGEEPDHGVKIRVSCGRGTYIRSICEDLGELCGCPAHMRSLIRTRSGVFGIEDSIGLEEARALAAEGKLMERTIPMDRPIGHLPRMEAETGLAKAVSAGAALPLDRMAGETPDEGMVTRIYLNSMFWGIAVRRKDRLLWRCQIPPEDPANPLTGGNAG